MTGPSTRRQLELLRFITGYQQAHDGISPSLADCARGMGIVKSYVHRLLVGLESCGRIRRLAGRHHAIEVLHPVTVPRAPDGAPLYAVPIAAWPVAE